MKKIKNFILMVILLLMGSVCLAQEAKKDSIWGLEVELNNNSIQMSYYWDFSNNGLENTFAFKVTFRYNDKVRSTYIQYEKDELWGKMFENCKIDTISDSVWRITIYDLIPDFPSFKIQDITKISLEGEYNCNVNTIEFIPQRLPVTEHEYVDLGLPSGTLWATCNVGATKPTEYGDYFAWGETKPKEVYADSTYKWFNADSKIYTKYNSEDGLKTLLPEDDAATANWGSEWRMPTNEEQRELVEECQYQMTEVNGVYGAKFTGKNGNSVFFPAAGFRYGSVVGYEDCDGFYWSSSLDEKDYARGLNFGAKGFYWSGSDYRGDGFSVRAVANKTTDIEEYVVSFYTQDSVLIESQKVEKGKSATAVDAPVVDGYEFIGWSDSSFTNVTKDLDIYAQYKAITKDTLPVSGQIAGHDYIDLGLPSGTLWATCNVGATTPTGYGHHFAWGETETKKVYDWSTYKWCEGSKNSLTKYFDKKMELDSEDDAAMVNWGKEWRMPTSEEQGELLENCYMVWTTNYLGTDVAGVIFYKAKDEKDKGEYIAEWRQRDLSASYNAAYDAHIFLPAAGGRWGNDNNSEGKYWSSSLSLEYDKHYHASFLGFTGKDFGHDEPYYCIYGFSVRAVANGTSTSASTISNHALLVYADNGTIHVANAQANTKTQVFDMSGKAVASGTTDANGNVEISLSTSKGVYVVTDGNQSTKVILK
ncbi:MAG: T9SS type A sorting domain-containing protein [Paludibacteraceae bacterium]|nr:T9SS type A sorting domain-containing protein [Paludibacteraceae bacterium]